MSTSTTAARNALPASGRDLGRAAARDRAASITRMAETMIDALIRNGAVQDDDFARCGFLKSEVAEMKDEAMTEARKARPDLFAVAA